MARGWYPGRGERHDRHHRLSAETAAAVWEPSYCSTLQVASKHTFKLLYFHYHICVFYHSVWHKVTKILIEISLSICFCVFFSAGAGRTGTFIALSNILERVKAEGLLDVFQTVKSLRMQRPHMVQTVVGFCRSWFLY